MGVKDQIRETQEYQTLTRDQPEAGRQPAGRQAGGTPITSNPVLDWEKSDVQFWMDVAQVVLLFLIWREISRGGVA